MGMYEDVGNVVVPYVLDLLKEKRTQTLCNAFNGWEKWFQGEFLLNSENSSYHMSQEDNVYSSAGSTVDFVLRNYQTSIREYPIDTCIVELKCMTQAQAKGDASSFATLVDTDIKKLLQPLQIKVRNPVVVRLMIAVTFVTKAGVISDRLKAWQDLIKDTCEKREDQHSNLKAEREDPGVKAFPKLEGHFAAFFIYWKQRI